MIVDKLENLECYRQLCPALELVCDRLPALGLETLPDGKNLLDGERLFANVVRGVAEPWECKLFEAHRQYLDVQIVLVGSELMGYAPVQGLHEQKAYDIASDIAFYDAPQDRVSRLTIEAGMFVVFFPQDAHKPSCRCNADTVHKVVLKVKL